MNRRRFLRQILRPLPAVMATGAGSSMLMLDDAQAQSSSYRALVCLFLTGGNDGLNMVLPIDTAGYQRYQTVRKDLAIKQADAIALNATHGMHPSLGSLAPVWAEQKMALMYNVGPLARPLTQADYLGWRDSGDYGKVPSNLFSHGDQQVLWQTAASNTVVHAGWGARLIERLSASPVVSMSGNPRFGIGDRTQALTFPGPGADFGLFGFGTDRIAAARLDAVNAMIAAGSGNAMVGALTRMQQGAIARSAQFASVLKQKPGSGDANPEISAAFQNLGGDYSSNLAGQLYQVAKLIKNRSVLGGNRHVFFVNLDGFDTHSGQLGTQTTLFRQLATAVSAFYAAMKAIGSANDVTLFTESDFGRTFKPNATGGTDHGWGGIHLVVGGSVKGGAAYGTYPSLVLGGPDDTATSSDSQGRWIPAVSVDQYAGTLINWFAPELSGQLSALLPNLANFPVTNLGFMNLASNG